jgi:hypothetical protein
VKNHEGEGEFSIKEVEYSVDTLGEWEHLKSYLKRNGGCLFTFFSIFSTLLIATFSSISAIWLNYWAQVDDPTLAIYSLNYFLSAILVGLISIGMAKAIHASTIYMSLHNDMVRSLLYAPLHYF